MTAEQEQACEESGMFELRNASSQNSNSYLQRFDRMNPWRRRRNFKPMKLQNSLVGTKAFIKDSLRQCARLVKAFGTKLILPGLFWSFSARGCLVPTPVIPLSDLQST